MEQELQYAYLLEIPVESCNVTTKKAGRFFRKASDDRLKKRAVEAANRKADREEAPPEPSRREHAAQEGEPQSAPAVPLPDFPAPTYPEELTLTSDAAEGEVAGAVSADSEGEAVSLEGEEELPALSSVMEELPAEGVPSPLSKEKRKGKRVRAERLPSEKKGKNGWFISAAAVCVLGAALFLMNAFWLRYDLGGMLTGVGAEKADTRLHGAFSLVLPTAGEVAAEDGYLVFSYKGGVYAPAEGVVSAVTEKEGRYTVEISHSDCFKTVIAGADMSFFGVGERVYRAQPVAYSMGSEVTVGFYENGARLLGCAIQDGVPVL